MYDDFVKIGIDDLLKTSSAEKHIGELNFPRYPNDERLCIVRAMRHYLEKTKDLRKSITTLFIATQKPHRGGVAKYYRKVDEISHVRGRNRHQHIQTQQHKDGIQQCSIRAKLPMATVRKTVWWKSDSVFRKFQNKPVVVDDNFSKKVLEKYDKL